MLKYLYRVHPIVSLSVIHFVKYITENGISITKTNELINIIDTLVKEFLRKSKSCIEDIFSLRVATKETIKVIDDCSISKMRKLIVYCDNCNNLFISNRLFCPMCKMPLIQSCSECNLTVEKMTLYEFPCNLHKYEHLECNHVDRVSARGCFFISYFSLEGYIIHMFSNGLLQNMVAPTPSSTILLARFCKDNGVLSSLVDTNSQYGWQHIGNMDVTKELKKAKSVVPEEWNCLENIGKGILKKDSPEQCVFHIQGSYSYLLLS